MWVMERKVHKLIQSAIRRSGGLEIPVELFHMHLVLCFAAGLELCHECAASEAEACPHDNPLFPAWQLDAVIKLEIAKRDEQAASEYESLPGVAEAGFAACIEALRGCWGVPDLPVRAKADALAIFRIFFVDGTCSPGGIRIPAARAEIVSIGAGAGSHNNGQSPWLLHSCGHVDRR